MGCIVAFTSIFVIAGVAIFLFLTVYPLIQIYRASDWIEIPCVVTHSEVEVHPSSEGGPTYSIDIRYRFSFDGEDYEGTRYNFSVGSSSGRERKAAVVREHPVGSDQICYVDPKNPAESVLSREPGAYLWAGFFGFPFMAVPLFILFIAKRQRARAMESRGMGPSSRRARRKGSALPIPEQRATADARGFVELKRESSRVGKVLVVGNVALVWSGLVGYMLVDMSRGNPDGIPTFSILFSIPFVLVGIGLLAATVYGILTLFNPRTLITLRQKDVRPGDRVEFAWEFLGDANRISALTMKWIGFERATHQVGTDTRTEERRFHEAVCLSIDTESGEGDASEIPFGTGVIEVPPDRHPSFQSDHNRIVWALQVRGTVRRWPDIKALFPIVVSPLDHEEPAFDGPSEIASPSLGEGEMVKVALQRGSGEFQPGETLRATIAWQDAKIPSTLEWSLFWQTSGLGDVDAGYAEKGSIDVTSETGSTEVELIIPGFPYSFSGKLVGLEWFFEARLRGRGSKKSDSVPVTISPSGEEWRWQ